ncbi:MAG: hypothetical protein Edafosvirus9_29 [Edafosvirus sp.]|uniref:Uncharacterized protein n=1 Tax=Edafosvirus sp. TaxID=2487765 RepID=A0A3G4ZTU5_9VIRU|nr:MAG: hypothetical protein Edafosvirus9_29 [Edafosvirus sp.]
MESYNYIKEQTIVDLNKLRSTSTIPIEPDNVNDAIVWHNKRIITLNKIQQKGFHSNSNYRSYNEHMVELTSDEHTLKIYLEKDQKETLCNRAATTSEKIITTYIQSLPSVPFEPDNVIDAIEWHNVRLPELYVMQNHGFLSIVKYEKFIEDRKLLAQQMQLKRYKPKVITKN